MRTSFLIPSFNHERYLEECLYSVLRNRVADMELIICDDNSHDGSPYLIEKWVEKYKTCFGKCTFIKNLKNYGLAETLNEMIAGAIGSVITGVASDDYILPGGVEAKLLAMEKNQNWFGAFSDGVAVGLNGELFSSSIMLSSGLTRRMLHDSNIMNTVLTRWIQPMNLQFWRRNIFKSHGGEFEFDSSFFCEDLNFALWALSKKAFGFIEHKCVAYRCRSWPQKAAVQSEAEISKIYADLARCYLVHEKFYPAHISNYIKLKSQYFELLSHGKPCQASRLLVLIDRGPSQYLGRSWYSIISWLMFFKFKSFFQIVQFLFMDSESKRYVKVIKSHNALDYDFYKSNRPRNIAVQVDPVKHYVLFGEREGLKPNSRFSPEEYVQKQGDSSDEIQRPLLHYLNAANN